MERHSLGQHDGPEETHERKVTEIIVQNHEGGISLCPNPVLNMALRAIKEALKPLKYC